MKNKATYGIVALAAMAILFVGGVSAFGGGFGFAHMNDLSEEDQAEMQAFHQDVQTAIENEDYESWKTLMESQLTQENFELLVEQNYQIQEMNQIREEMREAREDGDTETFEELRTQLQDLMPQGAGYMDHGMKGFGGGMHGDCPFMDDSE